MVNIGGYICMHVNKEGCHLWRDIARSLLISAPSIAKLTTCTGLGILPNGHMVKVYPKRIWRSIYVFLRLQTNLRKYTPGNYPGACA